MIAPARLAALREHARFGAGLAALFALTTAGALLLFALVPALLFGWDGYAMRSGSMAPAIRTGDVVLATAPPKHDALAPGTVVVFADARGRTLAHRVVGTGVNGAYLTRGDANAQNDSDPLPAGAIKGVGRMLVPYVGIPYVWWREGRAGALALLAGALFLCVWAARFVRDEPDPDPENVACAGAPA